MSDRLDYYFRQRVTEAELDLGFSLLEKAVHNLAADLRIYGVVSGGVPSPHSPVPDLSIDFTAPARAYDNLGQRLFFGTGQTLDCAVDLSGIPTDVSSAGNERWLGVFLRFKRLLSDPRTDGNSQQVFFRRDESFELVVRQAAEGPAGAAPRLALQPDELLLCDVRRRPGQTQIVNADLDTTRRQAFVFVQGSSVGITTGTWNTLAPASPTVQAALDEVDAELTGHFAGTTHRHAAGAIDFAPHGFVAANTVQGAVNELVDDLAAATGAGQIGAGGVAGNPSPLAPGTVATQLSGLLGLLNTHVGAVSDAHPASAISAVPHNYIAATNVQAQLQGLVAALADAGAAAPGSSRIGSPALPGAPVVMPQGTVGSQLFALLLGLNGHINEMFTAHAASTITVQDTANRLNSANAEDALAEVMQVVGADHYRANEAVPGGMHRAIHQPPFTGTKALLWDAQGTGVGVARFRAYLDGDSLWLVMNASWNGTLWARQATGNAAALRLGQKHVRGDAREHPRGDLRDLDAHLAPPHRQQRGELRLRAHRHRPRDGLLRREDVQPHGRPAVHDAGQRRELPEPLPRGAVVHHARGTRLERGRAQHPGAERHPRRLRLHHQRQRRQQQLVVLVRRLHRHRVRHPCPSKSSPPKRSSSAAPCASRPRG